MVASILAFERERSLREGERIEREHRASERYRDGQDSANRGNSDKGEAQQQECSREAAVVEGVED